VNHTEKTATQPDTSTDLGIDRTRLAHDRTLLAWIRTATSLITFGFAIQQFFRIARFAAPESKGIIGPYGFGLTMIIIRILALLLATPRDTPQRSATDQERVCSQRSWHCLSCSG
jgi:putative membrane protein